MKRVLTIAGSDSGGGAGIQADLKTFSAFGVYGASAITAVTAQNTLTVAAIHPVPPEVVAEQIEAVLSDLGADAVKTGMLFNGEIITAVAAALRKHRPTHLVVDPVMIAKSGAALLEEAARTALMAELLPWCEVVTPNLPEAEAMLGKSLEGPEGMKDGARGLHDLGPRYVLLKGGHLEGDPLDLLYDGKDFTEIASPRMQTRHTHGTGCTLSAALASCLALGAGMEEAFRCARDYVIRAIHEAPGLGGGSGPLHHGIDPVIPMERSERS